MAHNKTLAAQLYGEFKEFFPENSVEYFVSYYDYYQPEAYVPSSDTYIEKDASINEHIEQMRLSATKALLERKDAIIVATVSAIYGLGDPESYHAMILHLNRGEMHGSAPAAAPARGHAVHAQRAGPAGRHVSRARRRHRHLPGGIRARGDSRGAVRRDDRVARAVRSADRRDPAQGAALHGVPGLALRDAEGARHRRHRPHPRRAARPAQGAARAEQARRGAAPRAAHACSTWR